MDSTRLDAAALVRRSLLQPQTWPVGVYELDGPTITDVSVSESARRRYSPLKDTKDLFLSFACLYESWEFTGSALKWVKRYGLPLQADKSPQSMHLEELNAHAYLAWDTLVHYEALVHDEPYRALHMPDGALNPAYDSSQPDTEPSQPRSEQEMLRLIAEAARSHAQHRVSEQVDLRCYLRPVDRGVDGQPTSAWGWGFYDLLGAMYLQMMVIMERGALVGRCKQCGTAFSHRKVRDEHSPRRRVFCTNACRMAYKRAQ